MAYQFKIQLKGITKPPVWRRVRVPENFSFLKLHRVIQEAFGWNDIHLYHFSPNGYGSNPIIAVPSEADWETPDLDARKTKLNEVFHSEKQKFTYTYDFGDDWIHTILLEKILPEKVLKATCIAGKGTCPPEDCGGSWRYEHMKDVLTNPKNKEYKEIKDWLCLEDFNVWNANEFDVVFTNQLLNEL